MYKKAEIKKETIEAHQKFFNEIYDLIGGSKPKRLSPEKQLELITKYKNGVSYNTIQCAIKCGFMERVDKGVYKMKHSLNENQAKQVIVTVRKNADDNRKARREKARGEKSQKKNEQSSQKSNGLYMVVSDAGKIICRDAGIRFCQDEAQKAALKYGVTMNIVRVVQKMEIMMSIKKYES